MVDDGSLNLPQIFNVSDPSVIGVRPGMIRGATSPAIEYKDSEDIREKAKGSLWFRETRKAGCPVCHSVSVINYLVLQEQ
jgi:hypothetical protein